MDVALKKRKLWTSMRKINKEVFVSDDSNCVTCDTNLENMAPQGSAVYPPLLLLSLVWVAVSEFMPIFGRSVDRHKTTALQWPVSLRQGRLLKSAIHPFRDKKVGRSSISMYIRSTASVHFLHLDLLWCCTFFSVNRNSNMFYCNSKMR